MTAPRTPAWVTDSDEQVYQAERVALEGEVGDPFGLVRSCRGLGWRHHR